MLPADRLEWVEGWGMATGGAGYVFRPSDAGGVAEALEAAETAGVPLALRGAGCSYGDAALRGESFILDLSELNRVLEWNPESGVIDATPPSSGNAPLSADGHASTVP